MLIVYDTNSGAIADNAGTNSAMPDGPDDDQAYVNTDARGIDRSTLALLRLNDVDDADLVKQILHNRCHVDPATKQVVIDGPYPVQTLAADPTEMTTAQTSAVTYTDTRDNAPAQVTFTVNGANATVALTDGIAELDVTPTGAGDIGVAVDQDVPGITITVEG